MLKIHKIKNFLSKPYFPYLFEKPLQRFLRPIAPSLYRLIRYGKSDINTSQYWNRIWNVEKSKSWRQYENMFCEIMSRIPSGSKILDVGCGIGILMKRLAASKQCDCYGIDISQVALQYIYQQGFRGQVCRLPFLGLKDGIFDIAVATELLEHLQNPQDGLKEMKRVVKLGGALVLSVPDNCMGRRNTDDHIHQFDEKSLRQLLEKEGEILAIKSIDDIGGPHLVAVLKKTV